MVTTVVIKVVIRPICSKCESIYLLESSYCYYNSFTDREMEKENFLHITNGSLNREWALPESCGPVMHQCYAGLLDFTQLASPTVPFRNKPWTLQADNENCPSAKGEHAQARLCIPITKWSSLRWFSTTLCMDVTSLGFEMERGVRSASKPH